MGFVERAVYTGGLLKNINIPVSGAVLTVFFPIFFSAESFCGHTARACHSHSSFSLAVCSVDDQGLEMLDSPPKLLE